MSFNKKDSEFWKDTNTWRDEPDFWRKGIMKKIDNKFFMSYLLYPEIRVL